MEITIKELTVDLSKDYFDFFDNRAFTDDSPYRCYCQMYQMSKKQQKEEIENFKGSDYGLLCKNIAKKQIEAGSLCGYLAYVEGIAVVCFEIAPEYRGKGKWVFIGGFFPC